MPHRLPAGTSVHSLLPRARGGHVLARSLITRSPITVTPQTSIRDAMATMERMKVGTVIVVAPDRKVPVGIFTLQDVLRRVALPQSDVNRPIAEVMTAQLSTLGPQATAHQAAGLMARRQLRHILILDEGGGLLGIISKNDLHDYVCSSCVFMRKAGERARAAAAS